MEDTALKVCVQLDELALRILELLEEQVKCRVKLENAMKPGFVHIAKSRYIMGNRTVCSLQLPTEDSSEFEALATVKCEESVEGREHNVYKLTQTSQNDCAVTSNIELRKRKEQLEQNVNESGSEKLSTRISELKETKEKNMNPIKWFGVLVPQNLRMAQTCFQNTLPLVIDCVNVQNELQSVQSKYQRLLKEKDSAMKH